MIEFMRTTEPDLYYILNTLGTFLFFLTCIFQISKVKAISGRFGKKLINLTESKNIKFPTATIVAIIEICIYVLINYLFATNYTYWFGKMLDMGPNYFGIIMIGPFIFAVVCFILGIDIVKADSLKADKNILAIIPIILTFTICLFLLSFSIITPFSFVLFSILSITCYHYNTLYLKNSAFYVII